VVGFVMAHDNLSFIDAVEMLSVEAGLQMPKPDPEAIKKAEKSKGLHELLNEATAWMQAQVDQNPDILEYLEGRGMNSEIRERFRVGYVPADGQALRKVLQGAGYSDTQMFEAGLLKESKRGGDPYIFFRDRVMFPVTDRRGRVVAFGGRVLPEAIRPQNDPNFTPPKYINSSDTPLFDKGRMLYGESMARQAAREGHTILVTEGYMDVIACHKAGFKGAVAPMGTALTEDQILSLWSMMAGGEKLPILCFDGDNAGRSAASRACERILPLLKPGKTVRFAFMPEGEDPDSLLRSSGAVGFKSVLEASLSLFDFIWASHVAGREFETPEERAGLTNALQKQVSGIADPEIQKHYKELIRSKISDTFFKPYGGSNNRGGRGSSGYQKKNPASAVRLRTPAQKKSVLSQRILVAAVLNNPQLYHSIEEELGQFDIQSPGLDAVRQHLIVKLEEDASLEPKDLHASLIAQGLEQESGDILCESVYVHAAFCRLGGVEAVGESQALEQWKAVFQSMQGQGQNQEVKQNWKAAFHNSNEAEEEKLKDIVRIKSSE